MASNSSFCDIIKSDNEQDGYEVVLLDSFLLLLSSVLQLIKMLRSILPTSDPIIFSATAIAKF